MSAVFGTTSTWKNSSTSATQQPNLFATSQPAQTTSVFAGLGQTASDQNKQNATTNIFAHLTSASDKSNQNATPNIFAQKVSPFTTSQPAAPSLFGNTTTAATQPAQTTNLFGGLGQTASEPKKQNATPNMFAHLASAPAQSSSNLSNSSTQQNATPNMFAHLASAPAQSSNNPSNSSTQQNATPNMFAHLASTPAQSSNNLFNSSTQQNNLFGTLNQNKPEEKNMFSGLGQTNAQSQQQQQAAPPQPFGTSTFGGLSFGQSTTTNPQTPSVPGVKINIENLRPTTRFNDLHEDLQKMVETIDNGIQNHMQQKHDCDAIMPKHEGQLENIPNDVDFLTRKCNDVENALSTDAEGIFQAKKLVSMDIEGAKLSFGAIDNLKLPYQYQQLGPWTGASPPSANAAISSSLPNFFIKEAEEMLSTLEAYDKNMSEIETHLWDVEARAVHQLMQSRAQSDEPSEPIRELVSTFRDFEHGILSVAGKVVGLRDEIDQIKRGGLLLPAGGVGGSMNANNRTRRGVY